MDPFARIVVGYHGCTAAFARGLLLGRQPIRDWRPSTNDWDWLGHGVYFWEHSPDRAIRWAQERYRTRRQRPAVLGAYIQLGRCFDLLDEPITALLRQTYERLARAAAAQGGSLPQNRGREGKLRELDCMVINTCIEELLRTGREYDTVRGAFLEGTAVYPGAGFSSENHIQIAVRNSACILGVFQPNL
ncbi:MAG TPA: hypothetical protein VFW33_11795 [Gemmataceae bacterium]|nr:hypothetical protein [Gemmataceae bacterium]